MKKLYKILIKQQQQIINNMKVLHEFKQKIGSGDSEKEYTIKLKDISRRDRANLSVVYNAEYGKALARGLAPHSVLRKSAINSGGLLANSDIERAEELYRSVMAKLNEKTALLVDKEYDKAEALNKEIESLWAEYQEYEKPANLLYSRSAEFEAEKNAVMWVVLSSTYIEDGEGSGEAFPGGTDESRLNYYYECAEAERELETKVFDKSYSCFHPSV